MRGEKESVCVCVCVCVCVYICMCAGGGGGRGGEREIVYIILTMIACCVHISSENLHSVMAAF